jgi:RNA-directed DNA polymerase
MDGKGTSRSQQAMTTVGSQPMDGGNTIPWRRLQRNVFKLQKRIYQASRRGDMRTVRKLQRLLMTSRSAKLLAVRRVTQDNRGRRTAGVDGVKSLTPPKRLALAQSLHLTGKAQPVRRVWIPKSGSPTDHRPLGIPTMADRARQTLVKLALEPAWEARFAPNSYGFRPGRSCHDAITAIFTAIGHKAKYVLDADIEKCFDRIDQEALLAKVNPSPWLRRQLRAWLHAGVLDQGTLFPTEAGTMQGSPLSPLLANIALHGLEAAVKKAFPTSGSRKRKAPNVVVYADDLVILHEDRTVIERCQHLVSEWLRPLGLTLKPSKTRITHTLESNDARPGFDFLGYHIRQFPVGKTKSGKNSRGHLHGFKTIITPSRSAIKRQRTKLRETITRYHHTEQGILIDALNPRIRGWSNYYRPVASARVFSALDHGLYMQLRRWAFSRHPKKSHHWSTRKYWRLDEGQGWRFQPSKGGRALNGHTKTSIRYHVKVQGARSPYDGDWVYWSTRLGRHPTTRPRVARLLKLQGGRCQACRLYFIEGDLLEVDHIIPKAQGGHEKIDNLQLLHRYCHIRQTAQEQSCRSTSDKRHVTEEPCEAKVSRTVLKPSRGGDTPA